MICLPRGVEIAVAMIGVWKVGAACAVAEDDLPAERLAFTREDSGSVLTIDSTLWPEIMQTPPLEGYVQADDHDAAFAIYTSGSTGTPKGVLQEYGCFRLQTLAWPGLSRTPEETWTETLIPPLHSMAGFNVVARLLRSLDCIHILPYEIVKDPLRLNRYFTEHGINRNYLPPSALRAIGSTLSPSIRFLAVGGEGANGVYLDGVTMECEYAMTEAGFPLCRFTIDRPYALCPAGKPTTDEVQLQLLDEAGQPVPDGEEGEVCFEAPFFRGYINRPEETKAAFRGGLFHSGDLGKWDENGDLVLTGRASEMLKIGGNRVEPGEIETVFLKITGQDWCAVRGFPVGARTLLCLYYRAGRDLDAAELRRKMGGYLPGYMIPAKFQRVERVPLLPSGKTDKAALPEPDFSDRPVYAAPVTQAEQTLCRALEAVFEVAPIGLDDDFFDLGGDSLAAMAVLTEADLPGLSVLDIFEGRTPRHIAEKQAQRQEEEDHALSEARERDRVHPLPQESLMWFGIENIADYHFHGLTRFDLSVDAQKLCDALNRAVANRPALSMVVELDGAGRPLLRYDAAATPHYEVQRMTQAEFDAHRPALIRRFEMTGAPLLHAGVYETERNVYLFLDIHHMITDSSSNRLFADDLEKAYRGEPLGQDTYCTYLARKEREQATARYQTAKESLLRLFDDVSCHVGFTPDRRDGPPEVISQTSRRIITGPEFDSLLQRLGTSRSLLCIGITLLAAAKLEGAGRYLCLLVFHNRNDDLSRNAFGCLMTQLLVTAQLLPSDSVAGLFAKLQESWINAVSNGNAAVDAMNSSPQGLRVLRVAFYPSDLSGDDPLASLGGTQEPVKNLTPGGDNSMDQTIPYYAQSGGVVPMLVMNMKVFSPEKVSAISDALAEVTDRLLAVEDPEKTTVGQLLD